MAVNIYFDTIVRLSVFPCPKTVSSFTRRHVLTKNIPTITAFSSQNFPVEGGPLSVG
jgi:hypothetical protein